MAAMTWLKPAEAAAILQTTPEKVYELVKKPDFPKEYIWWLGKEVRINPAAFEPPAPTVVVEDEMNLARVAKSVEALQDELDRLKRITERPVQLGRSG